MSNSEGESFVEIRKIKKNYGPLVAVDNISFKINKGEIFGLMGSSGCGKSTLLRMLAGLEHPSEGRFMLDGQDMTDVPANVRPVNMMFQSYALFPHMTVAQNVAFGLEQDHLNRQEVNRRVGEMLSIVCMEEYARRKPHQLSGGQRQRVALARSLAKRPKLLLLDEPMAALDKNLRERMQLEVTNILEKVGVTCLLVTHDQDEAMTMSNRIGIMDKGELVQMGTPNEVYEWPNCRFSAEFLGSCNIFSGEIDEQGSEGTFIRSETLSTRVRLAQPTNHNVGMKVWIAVRPEKMGISREIPADGEHFAEGVVTDIAYMGSHSIYHIVLQSGQKVVANIYHSERFISEPITWGDKVYVDFDSNSAVVLAL
jgi:putrescine transport system ATP-binding protein